jgi:hypothetical protein
LSGQGKVGVKVCNEEIRPFEGLIGRLILFKGERDCTEVGGGFAKEKQD